MSGMRSGDDAVCPRCGGGFHCGMHDATPCPCTGLRLSAALQEELRTRYLGCLCLRCLQALAERASRQDRTDLRHTPKRAP
jgi:Cysteine-rich CWC